MGEAFKYNNNNNNSSNNNSLILIVHNSNINMIKFELHKILKHFNLSKNIKEYIANSDI